MLSCDRRPGIWLGVERVSGERAKRAALVDRVANGPLPGVVYAATSRHCEELALALAGVRIRAGACHGELRKDMRSTLRTAFVDGALDVMVISSELAAELEPTELHFVYHYDLSHSLDSYWAEIEGATRASESSRAILFYSPEDVGIRRFLAESGKLDREDIDRVAQAIAEADEPLKLKQLRGRTGLSQAKLTRALAVLEEVSLVESLPGGELVAADSAPNLSEAVEVAARSHELRREADQGRVEPMRLYAELSSCRRAFLLAHLGHDFDPPCNHCDVCESPMDARKSARPDPHRHFDRPDPFPIDSRVLHKTWGAGTVAGYEGDGRGTVVVHFDAHGSRRLSLEVVRREQLLEAAR
jgi:ATP-dependent DNA helicase RecQ